MVIQDLIWDEWNILHIARHGVRPLEVEEVCWKTRKIITKAGASRIRVIGQSSSGAYLTIFLAKRDGNRYYVVTARASTPKEKRYFRRIGR